MSFKSSRKYEISSEGKLNRRNGVREGAVSQEAIVSGDCFMSTSRMASSTRLRPESTIKCSREAYANN